jgi:hypothetical protein
VTRIGGRFSAMVPVPDTLSLDITRHGRDSVRFSVRNGQGQDANHRRASSSGRPEPVQEIMLAYTPFRWSSTAVFTRGSELEEMLSKM